MNVILLAFAMMIFVGGRAAATVPPAVIYENPAYEGYCEAEYAGPDIPEYVEITNGSMVNFAASGVVGSAIRTASRLNHVPNPLGLSHSGVCFVENPKYLWLTVRELAPRRLANPRLECYLSVEEGEIIMKRLMERYSEIIDAMVDIPCWKLFIMEATGDMTEIFDGVYPHVTISPLEDVVKKFNGNIYARPLIRGVPLDISRGFIRDYLGRSYETLSTGIELLRAIRGGNTREEDDRLFCSELAAALYHRAGIISRRILANNTIPEQYSSYAGAGDLLAGYAVEDIPLKLGSNVRCLSELVESDDPRTGCKCSI
ncbi:MAG: hypothetical protein LBT03_02580 [Holosporales bacterium]|jgi:hypothetical protein|nr:hypothetical protein [Holosporales bacterium]